MFAGFDEHLRRTRGVCAGNRRNHARFEHALLETVFADGLVDPAGIWVGDVVDFVGAATRRYRPATVELATTSLRAEGLRSAGEDFDARLPILSTHLGHWAPHSRYWYLSAAPKLLTLAAAASSCLKG